jgi:hypothetical protein
VNNRSFPCERKRDEQDVACVRASLQRVCVGGDQLVSVELQVDGIEQGSEGFGALLVRLVEGLYHRASQGRLVSCCQSFSCLPRPPV